MNRKEKKRKKKKRKVYPVFPNGVVVRTEAV
jgi:hypothetical protein